MARNTITETLLVDDVDGSKASETVNFGFEGTSYEIDLSKSNASALRKALKPYLSAARKVSKRKAGKASTTRRSDGPAVREWAAQNGLSVPARGRIPADVLAAYDAR